MSRAASQGPDPRRWSGVALNLELARAWWPVHASKGLQLAVEIGYDFEEPPPCVEAAEAVEALAAELERRLERGGELPIEAGGGGQFFIATQLLPFAAYLRGERP